MPLEIEIDGNKLEVPDGSTVMDAARIAGIYVPHFCYHRKLSIAAGDLLAIHSAGAYGMSMSSNYNTRPRVPEVIVDGDRFHVVRRRETVAELIAPESVLP